MGHNYSQVALALYSTSIALTDKVVKYYTLDKSVKKEAPSSSGKLYCLVTLILGSKVKSLWAILVTGWSTPYITPLLTCSQRAGRVPLAQAWIQTGPWYHSAFWHSDASPPDTQQQQQQQHYLLLRFLAHLLSAIWWLEEGVHKETRCNFKCR